MAKDNPSKKKREDIEIESAFENISPKKNTKKHTKSGLIISLCVTVIVLTVLLVGGFAYYNNIYLNGVILENVSIAGVDVGGMSIAQAMDAVTIATEHTYGKKAMSVKVFDSEVELPKHVISNFDARRAVHKAYSLGRIGSSQKKQADQQAALTEGISVDLSRYLDINEDEILGALAPLEQKFNTTLSQSVYSVEKTDAGDFLTVTLGTPEYALDLNDLYQAILNAYSENRFSLEYTCDLVAPEKLDLESIHSEFYVPPVDATLDSESYEVIPGTDGYGFDIAKAQEALDNTPYGQSIKIPFVAIPPDVSTEEMQALLFRDKLSTYTATSSSNSDRDTNLALACNAINGIILKPGEVFSYNEALGERTPEKGYRPGASYSGGETVITYGGGICQVSSSLYYCAMHADLEIVLREEHGYVSSYVPMGMDATVSWGTLDFQFRNNMDYPIKIAATSNRGSVTVSIYGTDERDYYVDIEYVVTGTDPYETVYKDYPADNKEGYKDGQELVSPYTGYTAVTYRCKYNKETKELISKDFEAKSVYGKRDKVICRIENAPDPTAPSVSPDAIGGNGDISDSGALPPEN